MQVPIQFHSEKKPKNWVEIVGFKIILGRTKTRYCESVFTLTLHSMACLKQTTHKVKVQNKTEGHRDSKGKIPLMSFRRRNSTQFTCARILRTN